MTNGIAVLSFVPIRKEMSDASEMVSQLLFGESYFVIAEEERWIRIRTRFDRYTGWISRKQHVALSGSDCLNLAEQSRPLVSRPFATAIIAGSDEVITLGAGSELPGWDRQTGLMDICGNVFQISDFADINAEKDTEHVNHGAEQLLNTAMRLLHTPYLWGGRSSFGCDCSGFVQTVFKLHHMALPRDAARQADLGTNVPSLREASAGDLVFFNNGGRDVRHVGLLLSPEEIIHCSGCVRIDSIDPEGIFNQDEQSYSHTGCSIKRLLRG